MNLIWRTFHADRTAQTHVEVRPQAKSWRSGHFCDMHKLASAFPLTLLWGRGFCFIPNEFNLLPFSLLEGKRLTVERHPALGTEVLLLQTLGMGIPPYTSYSPQDFTEIPCYWSQRGLRFETRLPVPAAFIVVFKCCLGLFVCLSFHQKLTGMHTL